MSMSGNVPMYLHGLEGSPSGLKASWMRREFGAFAPEMPAHGRDLETFERCVSIAADALRAHRPNLVVGSSFGGAVLMKLVVDGIWCGPCIFLAQAGVAYGFPERLPPGIRAILIHARQDEIIPFAHSEIVAASSGDEVELWPTDGSHGLAHIVEDGLLRRAVEACVPELRTSRTAD